MAVLDAFDANSFDERTAKQLLAYADRLARRGYVMNTLGNIALRVRHSFDPEHGVIYTKQMGISLEEMGLENVVVTDVTAGRLLYGKTPPSIGHIMNRTIFRLRPDINAVIHVHPNEVIAYFSATGARELKYISADTALILSAPAWVLEPNINVEIDASLLEDFAHKTNCIIMPNHGVTTLGRSISEAYHRMTSTVAEVQRTILALQIAASIGREVNWISEASVQKMYDDAEMVIYGAPNPEKS
jgi:L-fuculose-phosphate aldolase